MSTRQALETVKVWDYAYAPDGSALSGIRVTATLSRPGGTETYNDGVTIVEQVPRVVYAMTDGNGYWQMNLVPHEWITPSGSTYHIEDYDSGYDIQVPLIGEPTEGWQSRQLIVSEGCGLGGGPGSVGPSLAQQGVVNVIIDGFGAQVTPGQKGYFRLPPLSIITRVSLFADRVTDAQLDLLKGTFTAFPTLTSICAADKPTLAASQKEEDSTLTGWNRLTDRDEVYGVSVVSNDTAFRLSLAIEFMRTV